MDTLSAAALSSFPNPRRPVVRKQVEVPSQPVTDIRNRGPQTAGLDQGVLGVVNASRIAALQGTPQTNSIERLARPDQSQSASNGYRDTHSAITPLDGAQANRATS